MNNSLSRLATLELAVGTFVCLAGYMVLQHVFDSNAGADGYLAGCALFIGVIAWRQAAARMRAAGWKPGYATNSAAVIYAWTRVLCTVGLAFLLRRGLGNYVAEHGFEVATVAADLSFAAVYALSAWGSHSSLKAITESLDRKIDRKFVVDPLFVGVLDESQSDSSRTVYTNALYPSTSAKPTA